MPLAFPLVRLARIVDAAARMVHWSSYAAVGIGSGLGGLGRFWLSGWIARRVGEVFPWGTLCVNVSGSFAIGFIAALARPEGRVLITPGWRDFLMAGVLGGFTTFSSFSLQTLTLVQEGELAHASGNVVGSLALCLAGVWLGYSLGQLATR